MGVLVLVLLPYTLLHNRRPFGVEKEFIVQLFVEFNEHEPLPTVGSLLLKMFKEQNISFTRVNPAICHWAGDNSL